MEYLRLGREHLNRRQAATARGGFCRVFAVHPVNEERHKRAEAMVVNPKTFPAQPLAIGKGSASGHQITAGEARGTCPLAQFDEINAANGPMIKPFAYETPDFRGEIRLRLCRITAKDFEIGCIGKRK